MKKRAPFRAVVFQALRKVVPIKYLRQARTHFSRGENWLKFGDQWFPRSMAIEITEHCNRTCYYCPQSVTSLPTRRIELKVFIRALERVAELNWNGVVDYTRFNEPLLEKNLELYVRMTRSFCPKSIPQVISNGDALTEKRVESLLEAGVMNFCITRHPPYKPEWDAKIRVLAEKFPKYIQWHCIEDNELGNRGGLVTPKYQEDLNKSGCHGPTWGQVIDIDGNYLFCCCDYYRKHPMGNVFDHSILEGWRNAKYAEARASVRNKKPSLDVCVGCFSVKSGPRPPGLAVNPQPPPMVANRVLAKAEEEVLAN